MECNSRMIFKLYFVWSIAAAQVDLTGTPVTIATNVLLIVAAPRAHQKWT